MKGWRKGERAWARRVILTVIGITSIALSGTTLVGSVFGSNPKLSQFIFRVIGTLGLILAVLLEHIHASRNIRDTEASCERDLAQMRQARRKTLATLRDINRSADYYCARIRQCLKRDDVMTHLAAFLGAAFPSMCQELFDPDLLGTLFQPSTHGPKRLEIAYNWTDNRQIDRGFAIPMATGSSALPVDRKGVAGFAFATGMTHYIEMNELGHYVQITLGAPGQELVRTVVEEAIWKPSTAKPGYEALLCVPLCERLSVFGDAPESRALGVLCLEIPSKKAFTDSDVLAAWVAAGALARVLAVVREQVLALRAQAGNGPERG
jgi:uncharacterized membrane protein YuzA (DUF378 family)